MEKIICVGKNYLKHAEELRASEPGDAIPEQPIYFFKPPSTLMSTEGYSKIIKLRPGHQVHHEVEMVFRIDEVDEKLQISHFTFGLDLTLRDLQSSLKKNGQPWEKAKVFHNSCIIGPWEAITSVGEALNVPFELLVNGEVRQKGLGRDMRWKPIELLADLQTWFPIKRGDLLFTGTPEGVGPLLPGDKVVVRAGPKAHKPGEYLVSYELECR